MASVAIKNAKVGIEQDPLKEIVGGHGFGERVGVVVHNP